MVIIFNNSGNCIMEVKEFTLSDKKIFNEYLQGSYYTTRGGTNSLAYMKSKVKDYFTTL